MVEALLAPRFRKWFADIAMNIELRRYAVYNLLQLDIDAVEFGSERGLRDK